MPPIERFGPGEVDLAAAALARRLRSEKPGSRRGREGRLARRRWYSWGRGAGPDIVTLIGAVAVILAVLRALGLW